MTCLFCVGDIEENVPGHIYTIDKITGIPEHYHEECWLEAMEVVVVA